MDKPFLLLFALLLLTASAAEAQRAPVAAGPLAEAYRARAAALKQRGLPTRPDAAKQGAMMKVDEQDSLALVALYMSTNGASWENHEDWLSGPVPSWYGVLVTETRVTSVVLSDNGLAGTLPPELGNLTALETLDLGVCFLFCDTSTPNALVGSIPAELGGLAVLEILFLEGNQLSGSIPPELGQLSNLQVLNLGDGFLGGNALTGSIPPELGNLGSLETLGLAGNQLSGPIPPELGNLPNLTSLNLGSLFGGNELTGSIPVALTGLANLEQLSLDNNELSGPIPPELGTLSNLTGLSLSGNQLSGTVPPELGNLSALESLILGIFLTGTDDKGDVLVFDFGNDLEGAIPPELGALGSLTTLILANNAFSGDAPAALTGLAALETLWLNRNRLEGLLDLTGMAALEVVQVQENLLTFEDLEPNAGLVLDDYIYSPQGDVELRKEVLGADLQLSVEVGGENNRYQWFLGDEAISGVLEDPSFLVEGFNPADLDRYRAEVTNTVVPDLTLHTGTAERLELVVNDAGDAPDAQADDGACDVDPEADGDQCTLRAAVETSNQVDGAKDVVITFEIPTPGVPLIQPASELPLITAPVEVDGRTQPAGAVRLDGANAGFADGLYIAAPNVTVRGMVVTNFQAYGIRINAGQGHRIEANHIGIDPLVVGVSDNAEGGILVEGGVTDVTIGGMEEAQQNVIGNGILVREPDTRGVRVLRNVIDVPIERLAAGPLRVPIDLGDDGPTCTSWGAQGVEAPNRNLPPPRILKLSAGRVTGLTRPGATVVVYRATSSGTGRGRYFARAVEAVAVGTADGAGYFEIDAALPVGAEVSVTATDAEGNTSELSQLRRPAVYLPGVGGSWLVGANEDNLWIPTSTAVSDRIARLAMEPTGERQQSGEQVNVDGILEAGGYALYGPILAHLNASGYTGRDGNTEPATLDLWRFPYDWRRDVFQTADALHALIDRLVGGGEDIARSCEVDLVTHSNGGMVGSVYVRKYVAHSQDHVHRYITSGAPYLGTPQVAASHTRGYLFGIEEMIPIEINWGPIIDTFRNLPGAYGLMPSRTYWEAFDPASDSHLPYYLEDMNGEALRDYDATLDFMTRPKVGTNGEANGLNRNAMMWELQQQRVHELMNDWRTWNGPPQVFRMVGDLADRTTTTWVVLEGAVRPPDRSTRREPEDTDQHVIYRESVFPLTGLGDGTVALASATLGRDPRVGRQDFSGVDESLWIEEFENYPCLHLGLVAASCARRSDGMRALDRTVEILRSGYTVLAGQGTAGKAIIPADTPRELFYVVGSAPVAVVVEDEAGLRTGATDPDSLDKVRYEIPGLSYWPSLLGAVVSVPRDHAYTITVEAVDEETTVRVSRLIGQEAGRRQVLFPDQALAPGGSLALDLDAGGTTADAAFDLDADGDGTFEGSLAPAADFMSDYPGPAVPRPSPTQVSAEVVRAAGGSATATLTLPDVRGPVWTWSLADLPAWVTADALEGTTPATATLTLDASALSAGVHQAEATVTLGIDGYAADYPVTISLVVREEAGVLASVTVSPDTAHVAAGAGQPFTALGTDQAGLPLSFTPEWSATGGSIDATGLYYADDGAGTYTIRATDPVTGLWDEAVVEVTGIILPTEEHDGEAPEQFELEPNYPNPFNPATTITYGLPEPARVGLVVYDVLGRAVAVLVDGLRPAGTHRVSFDASRLPSGVYLYRLEADGFSRTRTMLLIK